VLRAPRSRVVRAIAMRKSSAPGSASPSTARSRGRDGPGSHGQFKVDMLDRADRTRTVFSYRWHPYPRTREDLLREPMTLVEFTLEDAEGGTRSRSSSPGSIDSARRRAEAFRMNERGGPGRSRTGGVCHLPRRAGVRRVGDARGCGCWDACPWMGPLSITRLSRGTGVTRQRSRSTPHPRRGGLVRHARRGRERALGAGSPASGDGKRYLDQISAHGTRRSDGEGVVEEDG